MASPLSLKLLSPSRIWLTASGVLGVLLAAATLSIWHLWSVEGQKLVDSQAEILVRSRINDFQSGNFRAAVEGLGMEFKDDFVEVSGSSGTFSAGVRPNFASCATLPVRTSDSPSASQSFLFCRETNPPMAYLAAIVVVFLAASLAAFRFAKRLEADAVMALSTFLRGEGVALSAAESLPSILSQIGSITLELQEARERKRRDSRLSLMADVAVHVAHDIKAPLAALELLITKPLAVNERYRALTASAIERIRGMAEGLTSLALSGESLPIVRPGAFALAEDSVAIAQEARLIHAEASNVSISWSVERSARLLRCTSVPATYRRVLSNIISNAAESGAQSIKIDISHVPERNLFRVAVEDDGRGISGEFLERVGTRGFTVGKRNGLGIGLFHARQAVESWGGELKVESQMGKGTTVAIVLPAAE